MAAGRDSTKLLLAGDACRGVLLALEMRNRLIREAAEEGWSYREIAQAGGLHPRKVREILTGEEGEDRDEARAVRG